MSVQHVPRRYSRFVSPLRLASRAGVAEALSPSLTRRGRQGSVDDFAVAAGRVCSADAPAQCAVVEQKRLSETDQITAELLTPMLSVSDSRTEVVRADGAEGDEEDVGGKSSVSIFVLSDEAACKTVATGSSSSSSSSCSMSGCHRSSSRPGDCVSEDDADQTPPQCRPLPSASARRSPAAPRPPRHWRSVRNEDSPRQRCTSSLRGPLTPPAAATPRSRIASRRGAERTGGRRERRRGRPVSWRTACGAAALPPPSGYAFASLFPSPSSSAVPRRGRGDAAGLHRTRSRSSCGSSCGSVTPLPSRRSSAADAPDCRRPTRVPRPPAIDTTGGECEGSWARLGSPCAACRLQARPHVVVSYVMAHGGLTRNTPPRRCSAWSPARPRGRPLSSFAAPTSHDREHDEDGASASEREVRYNALAMMMNHHHDTDCLIGHAKTARWTRYDEDEDEDEDGEGGEANRPSRTSSGATLRHDTVTCPRASKPFHALALCNLLHSEEAPCSLSFSTVCMTSSATVRHGTPPRRNPPHFGRVVTHVCSMSHSPCCLGTRMEDSWEDDGVVRLDAAGMQ